MGWKVRPSGRRYYYKSVKTAHGKVVTKYLGSGDLALRQARLQQEKYKSHQAFKKTCADHLKLQKTTKCMWYEIRQLQKLVLTCSGFYNPKGRGWRRNRTMTEVMMTLEYVPDCQIAEEIDKSPIPVVPKDIDELVKAAKNGDHQAALKIRKILAQQPRLFEHKSHSAARIHALWVTRISKQNLFRRELLFRQIGNLRAKLKHEGPGTAFDELLVDGVLMAYLEMVDLEEMQIVSPARDVVTANFQLKAMESATKRFEKAMRLLGETRHLLNRSQQTHTLISSTLEMHSSMTCETTYDASNTPSHEYPYGFSHMDMEEIANPDKP